MLNADTRPAIARFGARWMARLGALPRRWWAVGGLALLSVVVVPLLAVSRLEEQDSFCIGCHTLPEVTYHDRAQQARAGDGFPLDLSSAHYDPAIPDFRCIDCHRGDGGVVHRATTLALGARDAVIFLSGRADPTIEKTEIEVPVLLTAACVNCHTDALLVTGFENHFHNKLPDAYQAWQSGGQLAAPPDGPAPAELKPYDTDVLCVDCHPAHIHVEGAELQGYLDVVNVVYPACVECHRDVGHGPLELAGP